MYHNTSISDKKIPFKVKFTCITEELSTTTSGSNKQNYNKASFPFDFF